MKINGNSADITFNRKVNLGNYESIDIGVTVNIKLEPTDTVHSASMEVFNNFQEIVNDVVKKVREE